MSVSIHMNGRTRGEIRPAIVQHQIRADEQTGKDAKAHTDRHNKIADKARSNQSSAAPGIKSLTYGRNETKVVTAKTTTSKVMVFKSESDTQLPYSVLETSCFMV